MALVFCKLGIFRAMCSLLVGPLSFGMGTGAAMFQSSLATLEFISQLHHRTLGFLLGQLQYSPLRWVVDQECVSLACLQGH